MPIAPEVLSALIGVGGVLLGFLLRDVAIRTVMEQRSTQRKLLQVRIEQAYAPLEFLIYRLLHTENPRQKEAYAHDIGAILKHHSHLLSEQIVSALYTLLDDPDTGAALLEPRFFEEFDALKRQFYKSWHGAREPITG
jgi:hypothetical protein